jgi:O-antigen ligase
MDKYTLKGSIYKTNWALLLLIFIMPLRNIQLQYIPNLGGGINLINILFILSVFHAMSHGNKNLETSSLNSYLKWYILTSIIALAVGYSFLEEKAGGNWKTMKDQLIPILLVFVVQRSAVDGVQWRRIFLACLLPLPYCFKVVWSQYMAVSSWHYSDDMRLSGTFMDLGANEMAAYSITIALICLGCLITCWNEKRIRFFFILILIFSGVSVIFSYSRGGYVAFLLGAIVIIFKYKNTSKLVMPVFFILTVGMFNLPPSVTERFSSIDAEEGERDKSAESRFVFWEVAFNSYLRRPVIGYGYLTAQDSRINPYEMDTHNYYVKMLVERGTLGFITYLFLLRVLWVTVRKNIDWNNQDNIINGLTLGMSGAIAALMLGNMFGDRFSHYPIVTSFFVFIALISISKEASNNAEVIENDNKKVD